MRRAGQHDVEQAVVQGGVRHQVHAAAEDARVGHGDRVPVERLRLPVDHDLPARMAPAAQRPQRRVDVDELAERELRGVGDVLHVGVEARGRDPEVGAPAGVRDVDRALAAGGEDVARRLGVGPDAELAREVVAATAREHAEHAVGPAQLARDGAEQPVAAHRRRDLAGGERAARQLARVGERVRALDAEAHPARAQRLLDATAAGAPHGHGRRLG